MEGINFVALDVETANKKRGSICAIGLVKFINGKIVDNYESLVNPEEEFDGFNIHLHGITEDTVKDSPTYPEIVQNIIQFTDGLPVVMHNARFDSRALRECNEKYGINDFYMEYFCSYYLSRAVIKRVNYKLKNLAKEFSIPLINHNSLSDAQASGLLILELLKQTNSLDLPQLFETAYYHKLGIIKGLEVTPFSKGNGYISSQQSQKEYVNLVDKLDPSLFDESHPFYRKYAVVTGTLQLGTKEDAYVMFEKVGGLRVHKDPKVTKKTNYLIMGEQDLNRLNGHDESKNIRLAKQYLEKGQEIELIGEVDFLKLL